MKWIAWMFVVGGVVGCQGRRKEIEAYEHDVCACTDANCVVAVDAKYARALRAPWGWLERHMVSDDAERAMTESVRRAYKCAGVFVSTDDHCDEGGCPVGYACRRFDPSIPDGDGDCVRIPGYVAKIGEACGGPDDIACEPGSACVKVYKPIGSGHTQVCRPSSTSPSASTSSDK